MKFALLPLFAAAAVSSGKCMCVLFSITFHLVLMTAARLLTLNCNLLALFTAYGACYVDIFDAAPASFTVSQKRPANTMTCPPRDVGVADREAENLCLQKAQKRDEDYEDADVFSVTYDPDYIINWTSGRNARERLCKGTFRELQCSVQVCYNPPPPPTIDTSEDLMGKLE